MKKATYLVTTALLCYLPCATLGQDASEENSDLNIRLTKVEILIKTDIDKAFAAIDQLKAKYPNNARVIAAESDAYQQIDNPRYAKLLLQQAHQLDPSDDDITEELRKIEGSGTPFLSTEASFKKTNGDAGGYERITRTKGEVPINKQWTLGGVYEGNYVTTNQIFISNGQTSAFHEYQQQGEAYLRYDRNNGDYLKTSLYGANDTFGGGVQYQWLEHRGATTLEANYQKPDWDDFVVGVVDAGTKDDIKLTQLYHFDNRISTTVTGGVNRYGLHSNANLAETYQFTGELTYEFDPEHVRSIFGEESTFGINYGLDAEYLFDNVSTSADATTQAPIQPLPFSSHLIHSLTLSGSKVWQGGVWHLDGYGGYAIDELGGNGPLLEASLVYQPTTAFSTELKASRSILHEESADTVTEIGLELKWKFL